MIFFNIYKKTMHKIRKKLTLKNLTYFRHFIDKKLK